MMRSAVSKVAVISEVSNLANILKASAERRGLKISFENIPRDAFYPQNTLSVACGYDAVVADPDIVAPVLSSLPETIQFVQSTWAGVDNIAKHVTSPPSTPFYRMTRGFGLSMSSYALGHVLAKLHDVEMLARSQKEKRWIDYEMTWHPATTTVGVMGLGSIGAEVVRAFKNRGFKVIGYSRTGSKLPILDASYTAGNPADLAEFLRKSKVIVNVMPSTPSTRGILNTESLANCSDAIIVNMGRGDVFDCEESIIKSLDNGHLSHAVLDVFPIEPLPLSSLLWSHAHVRVTPHIAGISGGQDVCDQFMHNLLEEKKEGEVLWARGY